MQGGLPPFTYTLSLALIFILAEYIGHIASNYSLLGHLWLVFAGVRLGI